MLAQKLLALPVIELNHLHNMLALLSYIYLACFCALPLAYAWTSCQNVCGNVPVMYPFGTGRGCGSPVFENYINCTKGKLQLYTPTGYYYIQSVDYTNNIIIIQDPTMSTCSRMQYSNSFGLPVGSPFAPAGDTFVLLGCSSASAVYNSLSTLCNPAGTQICQSLYSCSAVTQIGLPEEGPTSSCCVYSSSQLSNPPYQINLALLQCATYTSVYSFGPEISYGQGPPPATYPNPGSWSYGIALKFYYDESASYASCQACQKSNGVCAFNMYGFVCVCSAGVNTTTQCYGGANIGTSNLQLLLHPMLWTLGFSMIAYFFMLYI